MATMLHVYREVDTGNKGIIVPELRDTITLSLDDSILAISITSKELLLFRENIVL